MNRKALITLLIITISIKSLCGQVFYGEHYTGIEYLNSNLLNEGENSLDNYSITLAEGAYDFVNYPQNFEGNFKYDVKREEHSMLDEIGYRSVGGRFQYNGLGSRGIILGVKGSLDYDNFYEAYNDYFSRYMIEGEYSRKSGKTKTEDDLGIKFYGDVFKKIGNNITVGFWNDIVLGKDESEEPLSILIPKTGDISISDQSSNTSVSLTVSPKIIFQKEILTGTRFIFEGYMENRKYDQPEIQVDDNKEDSYYKWVLNPQFTSKGKIGDNISYNNYTAFENEKFQYSDSWQHILKISPNLEYSKNKFKLGIKGGGYDFEDEIGIVFDNNEIFGYKNSNDYSAWIISPKLFLEYNFYNDFYIGNETKYRYGEWESSEQSQYLEEKSYIFYWKYVKRITDNVDMVLKNSYEIYRYSTDILEEKRLPDENILRLGLGVRAVF